MWGLGSVPPDSVAVVDVLAAAAAAAAAGTARRLHKPARTPKGLPHDGRQWPRTKREQAE